MKVHFHKAKAKTQIKDEDECQIWCRILTTHKVSKNMHRMELKGAKTRTRHILELKIRMEMEWKKMSERKLRR